MLSVRQLLDVYVWPVLLMAGFYGYAMLLCPRQVLHLHVDCVEQLF